jgi:hypothetical protein
MVWTRLCAKARKADIARMNSWKSRKVDTKEKMTGEGRVVRRMHHEDLNPSSVLLVRDIRALNKLTQSGTMT